MHVSFLGIKAKNTNRDLTPNPRAIQYSYNINNSCLASPRLAHLSLSSFTSSDSSSATHARHSRPPMKGSSGVFPFSIGCMSQSSVAVADPHEKKPQGDPSSAAATTAQVHQSLEEGGGGEATTKEKAASPGIVTAGVQRLVKGIKQSLSQMFAAYDDGEDDEEGEQEMVIGYPTDVQHVGHIGWDGHRGGLSKVGAIGMLNAGFSLPSSLSLTRQLEVAMDQAAHA